MTRRMLASLCLFSISGTAQETKPGQCQISGTAVNSVTGNPLGKAEIQAERAGASDASQTAFTTADAEGKFTLADLPPGQYRLKGIRNGYIETYYRSSRSSPEGIPITLESGQNFNGIQLKLVPFGVVAGTIRDSDGEPIAGVSVTVLHREVELNGSGRAYVRAVTGGDTDDLGQYRFAGLAPGKYFVRAEPRRASGFKSEDHTPSPRRPLEILLPTLYPGVRDPSTARMVEIGPGTRLTGVDIVLLRSTTQRVRGHAVSFGARLTHVSINYANAGGGVLGFEIEAKLEPNGDFEFPGVPPGSYLVTATAKPPAKSNLAYLEAMFYQTEYTARVSLEVGESPVDNVQLAVNAGSEVSGRLVLAEGDEGKVGRGNVMFYNKDGGLSLALIRDDLTFSAGLPSGQYYVSLQIEGDYVIRSIRHEGREVITEGLTIADAAKLAFEIIVAKDGGQIAGTVVDKEDRPVSGASVVLIPNEPLRARNDLYRRVESDQNGNYRMKVIPPGTYKLFAWTDVEPGIWWAAEFLKDAESKGEGVVVKAKSSRTVKVTKLD